MLVVDPRFLDVIRWAAETGSRLVQYGTIGTLQDPDKWRDWAIDVISIPEVQSVNPPEPARYPTWDLWASAVNQSLVHLG